MSLPLLWALTSLSRANAEVAITCIGVDLALFPLDEAVDVSPESLPALFVGNCAGSELTATLTVDAGEPISTTVDAEGAGIHWLDFPLAPDSEYALEVEAWDGTAAAHFTTGNTPIAEVSGQPELVITGSQRTGSHRTDNFYSVGLKSTLLPDPNGPVYELRRDNATNQVGVGDDVLVDGFWGAGEVCYVLTQFQADSTEVGVSDETCTSIGCSTTRGVPAGGLVGLVLFAVRRRAKIQQI